MVISVRKSFETICPFCGCGCKLNFYVKNNKIISASPIKDDPVSKDKPCIKGLKSYEALLKNRIKTPLIRKNGKLVPTTWGKAYSLIIKKIKETPSENLCFYGSGSASNEANYLLVKLAGMLKANLDSSASLCHASSIRAMRLAYGITAMSPKMDDVEKSDVIFIVGSDTKSDYPVLFERVLKAKEKGAKIVLIYDSYNFTSNFADICLLTDVGEFLPILNYLAREIIKSKKFDKRLEKNKDFKKYVLSLKNYELSIVSKNCRTNKKKLKKISEILCKSRKPSFLFGMALVQHTLGTKNALALSNLSILKNGFLIPMRGKNNIQGCGDVGVVPKNETFLELLFSNKLKTAVVLESNIAKSFPQLNTVHKKLKKTFVIYIGSHKNLMLKFSDVVLPCATHFEESGTMTNAERRVRSFKKVLNPIYGKEKWIIFNELLKGFGLKSYKTLDEITKEIIKKVIQYKKIKYEKLKTKEGDFGNKKIKYKKLFPIEYTCVEHEISKEFPYLLTTKRLPYHFTTSEMTINCKSLAKIMNKARAYMNPLDLKEEGILPGERITIISKNGKINLTVESNEYVKKGVIVVPYHFNNALVNKLIPLSLDPFSKEPNLKIVDVRIRKIKK